jgi:hypothetical protein
MQPINKRIFTEEEITYLKENYATTKNKYILTRLGVGMTSLRRIVNELGLEKIPNYREVFGKVKTKYSDGRAKNRPTDEAKENSRKKLYELWRDDKFRARHAVAQSMSLKARVKMERRRILFGLEQQTAWKVIAAPRAKCDCRYRLRKKGYIVDYDANVAYYTDTTIRVPETEEKAKEFGIKIKEYEQTLRRV